MDRRLLKFAQCAARLASVDRLDLLLRAERVKLEREWLSVSREFADQRQSAEYSVKNGSMKPEVARKSLERAGEKIKSYLPEAQGQIRRVLNALVRGEEFMLARADIPTYGVDKKGRVVRVPNLLKVTPDPYEWLEDLECLLVGHVSPFRQCASCNKFFVRSDRNRRYCSTGCVHIARLSAAARQNRRDYMKHYMAERRERSRRKTEKQKALISLKAGKRV